MSATNQPEQQGGDDRCLSFPEECLKCGQATYNPKLLCVKCSPEWAALKEQLREEYEAKAKVSQGGHTPEPWAICGRRNIHIPSLSGGVPGTTLHIAEFYSANSVEYAARAVACVNALAGIANPEEFARKAKAISEVEPAPSGWEWDSIAVPALMAAYVRGHQCDLGEQCPGCIAGYALERITGRKWTQEECEASVSSTEQTKEALNGR